MRRALLLAAGALALGACGDAASGPDPEPVASQSEAYSTQCPMAVVEGVDVSDGQGTIDWAEVAASGRGFAFIKATQGNYDTQSTFKADWAGAKAAGVIRSPYHFFDPTIGGAEQATWFLDELSAAGGLEPGDLPPMLDIECPTSSSESAAEANCEYKGNSGWAPSATIQAGILDWLTAVEEATGRKSVVYSYPAWFADVGVTSSSLAAYPLYIATLASCAAVPAPWTTAVFWQYSYTGTVAGITGEVDLDRFFGDLAQLKSFAAPPSDGGAGKRDAGADAGEPDAGDDSGALDASRGRGAGRDAQADDGGLTEEAGGAPVDGSASNAVDASESKAGCSCAQVRGSGTRPWALLLGVSAVGLRRRVRPRGSGRRQRLWLTG